MSTLQQQFLELIKNFKGKELEKVIERILESDLYITSEFLNCPNIQALKSGNKYYDTLYLFSMLTYADYKKSSAKYLPLNQKLLNKHNYVEELTGCNVKQCMFIDKKSEEIYKIKTKLSKNDKLHIVDEINENSSYEEKWFSVSNSNCSKGKALKIVSKYLNISIENTIAIGNDKNDISMFEVAGLSVAVANASDDIKSKVNHITLSNDEDGVAVFLETLIK